MATALISLGLIVIVGLIIRTMHKDKKNGTSCHCGGNCGACHGGDSCQGNK